MSVLNPASEDEAPECPLCLEYFELDDINFYPCSCGYQVKRKFGLKVPHPHGATTIMVLL